MSVWRAKTEIDAREYVGWKEHYMMRRGESTPRKSGMTSNQMAASFAQFAQLHNAKVA